MIAKLLLAFAVLLLQETATLTSLIFATHKGVYPASVIHILFLIATLIDIVAGYFLGRFLKRKFPRSKVGAFVDRLAKLFSFRESRYKRWLALFLLGNFSFPWLNSCIAGYMELPFWESAFFNLLGDILYYASLWLIAIGAASLFKNFYYGLIAAIVFGMAVILVIRFLRSKKYGTRL
ncbi:MAG: hypothetical protein JWM20_661 [Patescibacteria group bacterium]|nr:hypothetical protein [Patescibacteria group bacterium]